MIVKQTNIFLLKWVEFGKLVSLFELQLSNYLSFRFYFRREFFKEKKKKKNKKYS